MLIRFQALPLSVRSSTDSTVFVNNEYTYVYFEQNEKIHFSKRTEKKIQFYLSGLPNLRFQLRKQTFRRSHSIEMF